MKTMAKLKALIAGATGATGGPLAATLAARPEWRVVGLSRRPPQQPVPTVRYVQADMTDAEATVAALRGEDDISHVFYCGRAPHDDKMRENVAGNLAILDAVVRAAERIAPRLAHIHLIEGSKYYGLNYAPCPTPAREDAMRTVVDNFYYAQEDYLRDRATTASWTWSASRPSVLLHFSPTNARNLAATLATYAAMSRELGVALDFPASEACYRSLTHFTSTGLLGEALAWMATEPKAAGHAFNVADGDAVRWSTFWPRLAAAFNIPCGTVRPVSLADVMADKEELWQRMIARHGLQQRPLASVAQWSYADVMLARAWDEVLSTSKARAHGFHGWRDSEAEFLAIVEKYRAARILP
jgi:nucleoside-diphosphate-sugar epimerase